jgi:hypothetical protein
MLAEQGFRAGIVHAHQAEEMIDLIQMIHPVVVANDGTQMAAATLHQAIVGRGKDQRGYREDIVGGIAEIAERLGAAPEK